MRSPSGHDLYSPREIALAAGVPEANVRSIAAPGLGPGGESTFIVTVPAAGEVGRYRVSFRTGDHIVPYVDRRHGQVLTSK